MRFVEGYRKVDGKVHKQISSKDRNDIHNEIDKKMLELESTGLSREEILFEKGVKIIYISILKRIRMDFH